MANGGSRPIQIEVPRYTLTRNFLLDATDSLLSDADKGDRTFAPKVDTMSSLQDLDSVFERLIRGPLSDLEQTQALIRSLQRRVEVLESELSRMKALGREFWQTEALAFLAAASIRDWAYYASDETKLCSDLFDPEFRNELPPIRWVGRSGALSAKIAICRLVPLQFKLDTETFVIPEARSELTLFIDGSVLPWSNRDLETFIAEVPVAKVPFLEFSVVLPSHSIPPDKDVTFSFRSISIAPLTKQVQPRKSSASTACEQVL